MKSTRYNHLIYLNRIIIAFTTLFITTTSHAQQTANLEITFHHGGVLRDNFKLSKAGGQFEALSTGKKYATVEINTFINYDLDSLKTYYALPYRGSPRQQVILLGMKIYDKDEFEIYNAYFPFKFTEPRIDTVYHPRTESFIKRKKDKYTVSILCQDGYGCGELMQRVRNFFPDCPELIKEIHHQNISKFDIISITDYYIENCGEKKD